MNPLLLGTALAVALLAAPSTAEAQRRNDGTSMIPLLLKVVGADTLLENQNFEIVRIEMDIVSGPKDSYRTLTDRWTYGIIAIGDDRVADIDVSVYRELDGEWSLVTSDTDDGTLAMVTTKPSATARYKFVVNAQFASGYTAAHYALIVYHN